MPEITDIIMPPGRDRNLEKRSFIDPREEINKDDAASLVLKTLDEYETSRMSHQDADWNRADTLYYGLVPERKWPGSNKRRSNLPVQVVFDHLEAAFPSVVSTIFSNEPDWFEALPGNASTSIDNARAMQARLRSILQQQSQGLGPTGQWALELAVRSSMLYKLGIVKMGYDVLRQRPFVKWVDPRNAYFSPSTSNWVDSSPSWIERVPMSVSELEKFRNMPNFNLPSPSQLNSLAKRRGQSFGESTLDNSKDIAGLERLFGLLEPNPSDQFIDVFVYQSDDREIWMLGRDWVAWNEPNRWGFKTVAAAPYFLILGSLYGFSFADLLRGEQVFQTKATNAYVDELALNLNPPRSGTNMAFENPLKSAFHPGALYRVASPREDAVQPIFTGGITRDVFSALAESDRRAGRRTGQSEAVLQGVPVPSNANRTATGAQLPLRAASSRQFAPIRVLESLLLVPTLQKLTKITQQVEGRDAFVEGRDSERRPVQIPGSQLQGQIEFEIHAGTRALAKDRLLPVLGLSLQFIQSMSQQMQQAGKIPDIEDITRMFQDATGTQRRYRWFRDLNEQEQAAMQRPNAEILARQQAAQEQARTRENVARESNQAKQSGESEKARTQLEIAREKSAADIVKALLQSRAGGTEGEES